ncbi:uncharacterized protein E0L32_009616 [Thyridium curvatum]|uniref:Ubiquitin carboxyl-terminal hydrolase n=1 Tax=Thyridium curvatum TaxID=1093900 RepID=A0A507AIA1_9PEZI|nr:uncharacterized protein E0L32_009616 [Thyridium curvatum]TPX08912.1 hypothetical protein E0L32_009616 [Thyridium curvatum]
MSMFLNKLKTSNKRAPLRLESTRVPPLSRTPSANTKSLTFQGTAGGTTGTAVAHKKKDEPPVEVTPLEKMLANAGPVREDGTDKFFGMENFGNTCYCNSIVQALYFSEPFRDNVVNYPPLSPSDTPNGTAPRVNVSIRPPAVKEPPPPAPPKKGLSTSQTLKQRQLINSGQPIPGQPLKPEDRPDSPEYKKKQAMIKGPVLELTQESATVYGMDECTFTGLKDIFMALRQSETRTGVISPQRFLEIFRRDNEMFRTSMHQDAHEFYGMVLNDVITNVESNARQRQVKEKEETETGLSQSVQNALGAGLVANGRSGTRSPGTGWVHDIFEGVLTSETKCLTCETASQRDETFLDLSIDLEEHSSVTSCLRKFSAEEMLCERNKFHCDHCGGLQEAEKRMKIKKLPKILTLHLKRFKYTEDFTRLEKLFHRIVYPYHLRMFNTTDDAEDPDRLYELYAVVVHIGGHAYHGHYVSIIKTQDRGWLLFDDEMVEPVDKHFVRNFFGDKPGTACAYVLFYRETTFENVVAEQEAEGLEEVKLASQKAEVALGVEPNGTAGGLSRNMTVQPGSPLDDREEFVSLDHAQTAPDLLRSPQAAAPTPTRPLAPAPPTPDKKQSKEEREREKKEAKAAEKARKAAEKEQAKLDERARRDKAAADERARKERLDTLRERRRAEEDELKRALEESKQTAASEAELRKKESNTTNTNSSADTTTPLKSVTSGSGGGGGFLNRSNRGSKSMSRKSFGSILGRDKDKGGEVTTVEHHHGNGNSGSNGNVAPSSPATGDNKPLKERFSFSLGRKKSNSVFQ